MAYENFIPTVWAEAINRELEKALVYAEGCNRQYDGEVKAMGDTVRILGVGRPTITTTTDKAITLSAPESVEDSRRLPSGRSAISTTRWMISTSGRLWAA